MNTLVISKTAISIAIAFYSRSIPEGKLVPPSPRKMSIGIIMYLLNNSFRYQIMVQAKIIVQVTNKCGKSNRTVQKKRITVKFKQNLIIVIPKQLNKRISRKINITYDILCFCTETMMKKTTK